MRGDGADGRERRADRMRREGGQLVCGSDADGSHAQRPPSPPYKIEAATSRRRGLMTKKKKKCFFESYNVRGKLGL